MTTNGSLSPFTAPSLTDPVWRLEHLAACFGVSVDTAREYAARQDFPPARQVSGTGGRLLWPRQEVLDWFAGLPARDAATRRRTGVTPDHEPDAPTPRPYRPRARRAA